MTENRVTLNELAELLSRRDVQQYALNLILVAMPLATAHEDCQQLADALEAEYVDYDCGFLKKLESDGWEEHVQFEQRNMINFGQRVSSKWLHEISQRLGPKKPVVIGNINLAVRYETDLAAALYDASKRGLCVIAAAGYLQGQTLYIHGRQPQTGANSPVYEVVPPSEDPPPMDPQVVQDQLL